MERVVSSVIPESGTQPALTMGEVMVSGQMGTRSLVLPMSPRGKGGSYVSTSLEDPHFS